MGTPSDVPHRMPITFRSLPSMVDSSIPSTCVLTRPDAKQRQTTSMRSQLPPLLPSPIDPVPLETRRMAQASIIPLGYSPLQLSVPVPHRSRRDGRFGLVWDSASSGFREFDSGTHQLLLFMNTQLPTSGGAVDPLANCKHSFFVL